MSLELPSEDHYRGFQDLALKKLGLSLGSGKGYLLQGRLQRRNKRSIESTFKHPRFRAAYDFLLLREQAGEELDGLGQWWTDFQTGDQKEKTELSGAVPRVKNLRRRRSKRKRTGDSE